MSPLLNGYTFEMAAWIEDA